MRKKLAGKRISDGFTIVELVVVIAVVAVLAAVLIPSFAEIIEKAKASKETQESRNARLMERIGEIEQGGTSNGSSQSGQTEQGGESGQSGGTGSENDHALLLEDLVMVVGDFVRYDDGGFSEISSSDESVVAVSGSEISAVGIGEAEVTLRRSLASSLSSLRFTVKVVDSVVLQPGNNFQHSITNLPVTDVVFGYTWEHADVAVPENRQNLNVRASVTVSQAGAPEIGVFISDGTLYVLSEGKIFAHSDSYNMFFNHSELKTVRFENFDTRNATSFASMFSGCSALTSIDFGGSFSTGNVTTFKNMFYGCSALTGLDLSGFDTGNVTTMQTMFYNCTSLEEISGLENFATGSLYDSTENTSNGAMAGMFHNCSALKSLDLRSFDTSGVKTMHDLFNGCSSLKGVHFGSGFVNANVTNLAYMFNGCSSLVTLELSGFDTFEVTNMNFMFSGCSNLESIIVTTDPGSPGADPNGRWSVEKAASSTGMFTDCVKLPNYTDSYRDRTRANTLVNGYLTEK